MGQRVSDTASVLNAYLKHSIRYNVEKSTEVEVEKSTVAEAEESRAVRAVDRSCRQGPNDISNCRPVPKTG